MNRLRKTSFPGVTTAAGLYFPCELLGMDRCRQRILQLWQPEMRLYQIEPGLVLIFKQPRRYRSDQAPATPLQLREGSFVALPLSEKQWAGLILEPGSIVYAWHGQIQHQRLLQQLEPGAWIGLGSWSLQAGIALGAATQPLDAEALPQQKTGRTLFGEPRYQASQALQALLAPRSESLKSLPSSSGISKVLRSALQQISAQWAAVRIHLPRWFRGFLSTAGARFERNARALPRSANAGRANFKTKRQRLSLAAFLLATPLGALFRSRQERYLRKLVALLENGDWEQALKHAVPLGGDGDPQGLPALGLPVPRSLLKITTWLSGADARVLGLGADYAEYLRQRYRRSFEQLNAQGRFKDAAFVLAELLREEEEAVQYLEKHAEFALAAELAEGRQLRAALVVRQWILAGNLERAVRIARLYGAYGEALALLEARTPAAVSLRLLWAHELELQGDYLGAVLALAQLKAQEQKIRALIERGLAIADYQAAELLALRLRHAPELFEDTRERVQHLLVDASAPKAELRWRFAERLLTQDSTAETRCLARALLRSILQDVALQSIAPPRTRLQALLHYSADPALKADVQRLRIPKHPQLKPRDLSQARSIELVLNGSTPIFDCKLLSNSDLLVALGEGGAVLLNAQGRIKRRFTQPCTQLVLADQARRALALAGRGRWLRVSVLELDSGVARVWGEVESRQYARSYNGQFWFVAGASTDLLCYDMLSNSQRPFWSVKELAAPVSAIARSSTALWYCVTEPSLAGDLNFELWRYELPTLTLRERRPLALQRLQLATLKAFCLDSNGRAAVLTNQPYSFKLVSSSQHDLELPLPAQVSIGALALEDSWAALSYVEAQQTKLLLLSLERRPELVPWQISAQLPARVNARVTADEQGRHQASPTALRFCLQQQVLLCWGANGGIAALDLRSGSLQLNVSL